MRKLLFISFERVRIYSCKNERVYAFVCVRRCENGRTDDEKGWRIEKNQSAGWRRTREKALYVAIIETMSVIITKNRETI